MNDEGKALTKRTTVSGLAVLGVLLIFRALLPWVLVAVVAWWAWKELTRCGAAYRLDYKDRLCMMLTGHLGSFGQASDLTRCYNHPAQLEDWRVQTMIFQSIFATQTQSLLP